LGLCHKDNAMKKQMFAVLMSVVVSVGVFAAAPEPAVVQGPDQWTVNIRFEHPRQIAFRCGEGKQLRRFWYMIIAITNKTGRDVGLYPGLELMTDTFEITPAGRATPPVVFQTIKRRHQSDYPLLESLQEAGHKLLQGEDNARDIAVIWPDFDPEAGNIQIFISGLSNETAVVEHPVATDEKGKAVKVFLRKTLEVSYALRGDPALRGQVDLIYQGKRWIMR